MSISEIIFFSYLTDFSYFPLKQKFWNCRMQSEQVKNDLVERVEDGFSYFHWFSILTRIIPANLSLLRSIK
jgi:hypothetical protein